VRDGPHLDALREALALEADAHRRLLAGDQAAAAPLLRRAAARYRASWELAPPGSFGRLIGMLKAAILAGGGAEEARYARAALAEQQRALPRAPDDRAPAGDDTGRRESQAPGDGPSPPAAYALALAALVEADDSLAARAAAAMRRGGPAFARAADGVHALADDDRDAYARAAGAIVADFEAREDHLTGVPIADTALVLDRLAEQRGIGGLPASPVLPPSGA
jgi:hypothetical protein